MEISSQQVSHLLQRWSECDSGALDELTPLVYGELRLMARRYMRRQASGHTLQTTALIHEAYLRLRSGHRGIPKGAGHKLEPF